jgi:rRNA processing protein Krr1/Pno1
MMKMGVFGTFDEMHHIIESLIKGRDYYLVSVDFPDCINQTYSNLNIRERERREKEKERDERQ